ncbi:MAG: hypothetical protein D6820_12450, partial [Lentisphaerae bacterium]
MPDSPIPTHGKHRLQQLILGMASLVTAVSAQNILPGQEYDGVKIDQAKYRHGAGPARVIIEDKVINTVSPRLFGYNFSWYQSQVFCRKGSTQLRQDLIELAKKYPLMMSRMSGTGSQCFRWKDGIGPLASRKKHPLMPWKSSAVVPRFGPLEWIRFCRAINRDVRFSYVLN